MKHYILLAIQLLLPLVAWAAKDLPCGISVDFLYNRGAPFGSNLVWTVVLVNRTNTTLTCKVIMHADVLLYNGSHIGKVASLFTTNTLAPNTTSIVNVTVTSAMYTKWTGATYTFELNASLDIEGRPIWGDIGRTTMYTSHDIITVNPTPPIQLSNSLTATVRYLNPLPGSLHNVKVIMTAGDGLNGTNNIFKKSYWDIETVAPNAWITVSTNYIAGKAGRHNISALIRARELEAVEGYVPVQVIAPQFILAAQVTLKPEALEVSPGVLTAFVRLPAGYPVSGITSATCDGAPCERMMLNDDATEMIIKFRRQDIEVALAQTGESIDTNFVVRGTWQGAEGTHFFYGVASIKKIVGEKEKKK